VSRWEYAAPESKVKNILINSAMVYIAKKGITIKQLPTLLPQQVLMTDTQTKKLLNNELAKLAFLKTRCDQSSQNTHRFLAVQQTSVNSRKLCIEAARYL
jgi:hypothetical protein